MSEDVLDSTCFPYRGPLDMVYAMRDARTWASERGNQFEIKRRPLGFCRGYYRAVVYRA